MILKRNLQTLALVLSITRHTRDNQAFDEKWDIEFPILRTLTASTWMLGVCAIKSTAQVHLDGIPYQG